MASLTIEVSQRTAVRLETEAQQRGLDLPTYVRHLLGDDESRLADAPKFDDSRDVVNKLQGSPDDQTWLDSPEAVVARIRALGPDESFTRKPTANLSDLLATRGVDQEMDPDEWDRWLADLEAEQKAVDLADFEKTLRDFHQLPAENDSGP